MQTTVHWNYHAPPLPLLRTATTTTNHEGQHTHQQITQQAILRITILLEKIQIFSYFNTPQYLYTAVNCPMAISLD